MYKKDFPILKRKINGYPLVYLDSAATSQKPQVVIDSMKSYYENYNANAKRGLYPIAEEATQAVQHVRQKVAKFINAKDPSEVIFVRNATEAINLIAYTFGEQYIEKDDEITTTIMEHHANFVPWQQLAKRKKVKFDVIDIDDNFDLGWKLKDLSRTKILAITLVSNVLGIINPVKKMIKEFKTGRPGEATTSIGSSKRKDSIGQKAPQNDKVVLVDASQAVPHMNVDVQDLDADFLVFSGHKMLAGTGVGVLYGKKHLLEKMPPFLFGGEMIKEVGIEGTTFADIPHKFEAGTLPIADIVSLGAAVDYLENIGMDNIQNHELRIMKYGLERLREIEGIKIFGPQDLGNRAGVISFTLDGIHPHDIAQILGDRGICIRAGHHCAMPLHKRLGIPATARASFYIYNDETDVDALIVGLKHVIDIFRKKH